MALKDDNTMVNIGRLTSAVGLKGEIKVLTYAEDSENLHEGTVLYMEKGGTITTAEVTGIRFQKNRPVIRLENVTDRNGAEALRNMEIYISEEDLEELPEGEYYIRDLIGCEVYDRASGRTLGKVDDVLQNTAQSVYRVLDENGKEILIPAVEAFEREIDPERGVIEVELIPGFLEGYNENQYFNPVSGDVRPVAGEHAGKSPGEGHPGYQLDQYSGLHGG